MALLVWTQCAPTPDLQLGDEAHYNLLFKWGHFKIIVAKYQTGTLWSVKVVPLIMMQGQPVVTVHDMLFFFSCMSWFLVSSFLLGTFRTCWMYVAWHSTTEAEWVPGPEKPRCVNVMIQSPTHGSHQRV